MCSASASRGRWKNWLPGGAPALSRTVAEIENLVSPRDVQPAGLCGPAVKPESTALAVIDGTLCQLTREGARAGGHLPLATAVLEFHIGSLRYYVREHPHGLLPGLPNLYCLDAAFRLKWMAEWPETLDPCTSILGEEGETVVVQTSTGAVVRLEAETGRLLRVEAPMAAAI